MTLAIREVLTDRLLDASGAWTNDQQRVLLFSSFPEAVTFKEQKHLELAHVIEFPPRFPLETGFQLSDLD